MSKTTFRKVDSDFVRLDGEKFTIMDSPREFYEAQLNPTRIERVTHMGEWIRIDEEARAVAERIIECRINATYK